MHSVGYSPPLFAGASLKHGDLSRVDRRSTISGHSPPLFAGASLKRVEIRNATFFLDSRSLFPPAFCGGLIEADFAHTTATSVGSTGNSPPLFAGASLKRGAVRARDHSRPRHHSPPLFAGASLKFAPGDQCLWHRPGADSPPLFAGASLKLRERAGLRHRRLIPPRFSRGLRQDPVRGWRLTPALRFQPRVLPEATCGRTPIGHAGRRSRLARRR